MRSKSCYFGLKMKLKIDYMSNWSSACEGEDVVWIHDRLK